MFQNIILVFDMTLKQMREVAGLKQKQLARLANLDQGALSRLETGRIRNPEYDTLMKLAIAFKSHPDAIMDAIRQSVAEAA